MQRQPSVPQLAKQTFTGMCNRLQHGITQHSAASLDGVDGTEDFGQPLARLGITLQSDQIAVQQVESFGTLSQELLDDLFHPVSRCGHGFSSAAAHRRKTAWAPAKAPSLLQPSGARE